MGPIDANHDAAFFFAPDDFSSQGERLDADLLILGSGLAGLMAALRAAERAKAARIILLTRGALGASASRLAQGGLAAAVGEDDTPARHVEDTVRADRGANDRRIVERVTREASEIVRRLAAYGIPFARTTEGAFHLGLEGGHTRRRIVHAGGAATGRAVVDTLAVRVRSSATVSVFERTAAFALLDDGSSVLGAVALRADGSVSSGEGTGARTVRPLVVRARATLLATGGVTALFGRTTHPPEAFGEGIALAAGVGATVRDRGRIQFHPTALDVPERPLPLLTEALRGEGARLLNAFGERFMPRYDPAAELAPRDVVARAVFLERRRTGGVWLDLRPVRRLADRFPTIDIALRSRGFDPDRAPVPVVPAAHFTMGGIETDASGRTTVPRLYAAGEVAWTGLHGHNRLAGNGLLEAAAFGGWAAEAALDEPPLSLAERRAAEAAAAKALGRLAAGRVRLTPAPETLAALGAILDAGAGLARTPEAVERALQALSTLAEALPPEAVFDVLAAAAARLVLEDVRSGSG
ncbi:MAG: FAD-binding protein [Hydrogenibacillus schlegelii]|nr:FAD-binding protein [Hydrogenibacillus schlegelii]